jgi:hypothetical protein
MLAGKLVWSATAIAALVKMDKFEGAGARRGDGILKRKIANAVFTATGERLSELV